MEANNFLTWLAVVLAIAGFALISMLWAYVGAGSVRVRFTEPVDPSLPSTEQGEAVVTLFQQGVTAFQSRNYQQAADYFTQVIQQNSQLAAAHHNRALALANLRQDNAAAQGLARAGELYLEQSNGEAIALLKHHLDLLKA